MTTLPQTSPIRLPRTGPGGQMPGQLGPIQAQAHPVFPMGPQAGAAQMGPAEVWRVIRSNLWLILFTLVLFGVGGYLVNRYILKPYFSRYQSTALLRISTKTENMREKISPLTATESYEGAIRNEALTQASMLKHESLLIDVLSDVNSKVRETTWWKEFGNNVEKAKEDLVDYFVVAPIPDSRLLSVSMEYRVPEDCRIIVTEIVDKHLKKERRRRTDEVFALVAPQREQVNRFAADLSSLRRRINENVLRLGPDAIAGTSIKQIELQRLYDQKTSISRELAEARNELAHLHGLNETGNDPPTLDDALAKNQRYVGLQRKLDDADTQIANSGVAPGHPKYAAMQGHRNDYAEKLDDERETVKQSLFASLATAAQAEIDSKTQILNDLLAQIAAVSKEVSQSERGRQDLAVLQADAEGLSKQWEKANEDLSKLEAVSGVTDSSIDIARPAQTPETPSFPKLEMVLTVSLLLGLALSLGIAFIRELTDNTVRTPQDLARVGNMNLLGMIPHEDDDPQAAGSRLPLVIFDAPQSMLAESFRQVRSRLQHAAALETTRSMLVTSAGPGDGKTTVAVNLAAGLALNGRRILLVDANFRRPQMHNVFDTTNEYGLSDVLNSLDAFDQCVQTTAVPNLSVLTSGAKPLNPTELLESQLLIDFIERALEEYDHVIFDTGPLPLVSETIALAPRVDGVITVVRARANSRGLLQRVRDTLRQVKAEHIGVVLNAVRAQAGGYYGRSIVDYYKYQNTGMNGHVNGANGHSQAALMHSGMPGNGRHPA